MLAGSWDSVVAVLDFDLVMAEHIDGKGAGLDEVGLQAGDVEVLFLKSFNTTPFVLFTRQGSVCAARAPPTMFRFINGSLYQKRKPNNDANYTTPSYTYTLTNMCGS